ncbi:hypothetical protein B0H17DRAFT_118491 [Mycena rosella]|uniref:Uncharacterized protein n=1 Tax=Mycena rosella TaxID=1033263 RepID=A0AAD7DYF0_MYCRO|nr:hypothetical protein B0H17DRAFT_118491 [Mycena rosella]
MHATSATIPTVQHGAETPIAVDNTHGNKETTPVNHNGPQCAQCGWRGGSHAYAPSL